MNCLQIFHCTQEKGGVQAASRGSLFSFLAFFLACSTESNYGGKIPIVCFAQGGGKETLKVSLFLISKSDNQDIALGVKRGYAKSNFIE